MANIWKIENPELVCVAKFFGGAELVAEFSKGALSITREKNPALTIL